MAWLWLSLLILTVVLVVVSKNNIFLSVVPGLIVSCIMDFFDAKIPLQIAVCVVSFILFLIVYKVFISPRISGESGVLSLDSLVGEKCTVVEKIDNFAGCGLVKIGKQQWSARGTFDDDVFEIGEILTVVAIEGVKLICKKN